MAGQAATNVAVAATAPPASQGPELGGPAPSWNASLRPKSLRKCRPAERRRRLFLPLPLRHLAGQSAGEAPSRKAVHPSREDLGRIGVSGESPRSRSKIGRSSWSGSPGKPTGRPVTDLSWRAAGRFSPRRSEFLGCAAAGGRRSRHRARRDVISRALAAALTAMKEADDFLPRGSRLETEIDLPGVVAAHATPVLKSGAENVTPMTALKRYFTFAQEQFAAAADHEVAGSMALHALGKLHERPGREKRPASWRPPSRKPWSTTRPRCWSIPRTSWRPTIWACCWRSAEITTDARTMLEHSLALVPAIHHVAELGRGLSPIGSDGAGRPRRPARRRCYEQAELARRQMTPGPTNTVVRWVDPRTFAADFHEYAELAEPGRAAAQPGEPATGRTATASLPPAGGQLGISLRLVGNFNRPIGNFNRPFAEFQSANREVRPAALEVRSASWEVRSAAWESEE